MHTRATQSAANELRWLDQGPAIAVVLFAILALYTVALLATTMRRPTPALGRLAGQTLYRDLVLGLGLLATIPAIALALVLGARAADQREERAASLLYGSTRAVTSQLNQYFEKHKFGIASIAQSIRRAGRYDTASMTEWLESHHGIYTDYLTMLIADSDGDIVTATALIEGQPSRVADLKHNVSDRPYFLEPMRSGDVFVSDVFQGRGLGRDPIVAVSAPISTPTQQRWGIVEGSLNLSELSQFRTTMSAVNLNAGLLVLDSHNRVIYASDEQRYPMLASISGTALARLGLSSYADYPAAQTTQQIRRSDDGQQLLASATTVTGWKVITNIPLQPIYAQVLSDFKVTLVWLLASLFAATMLSAAIARRVTRPLKTLTDAVRALDLEGSEAKIESPQGAPAEIREVFGHLNMVSTRLHAAYRQLSAASEAGRHYRDQLEHSLTRREAEIASRTRELELTNRKLRELSNVDPLTGLANRRRLQEVIDQSWRHGLRENTPLSVILVDIDFFKAYNDTYGHQAGDQCLIKIGQAIRGMVSRPLDLVARCGGEEFMMVLANTEFKNAVLIAERTRQMIVDLAIPHNGSPDDSIVTLSLGVASQIPQRDTNQDALIRQADAALYHAKENGRNQVAQMTDGQTVSSKPDTAAPKDTVSNISLLKVPATSSTE